MYQMYSGILLMDVLPPPGNRCVVPQVTVLTPILDYGRCFLRHPYEHNVRLQNDTELPAKYELLPQHLDATIPILYTSPQPKGIIPPYSTLEVPVVITPQGLEELDVMTQFLIFGSPDPPLVRTALIFISLVKFS